MYPSEIPNFQSLLGCNKMSESEKIGEIVNLSIPFGMQLHRRKAMAFKALYLSIPFGMQPFFMGKPLQWSGIDFQSLLGCNFLVLHVACFINYFFQSLLGCNRK